MILSADGPSRPLDKLVAVFVAKHMDSKLLETYVSASSIATILQLTEKTVRGCLTRLVESGWLAERIEHQGRAHWRRYRTANYPESLQVAVAGTGSAVGNGAAVPVPGTRTEGGEVPVAGTGRYTGVPVNGGGSGVKSQSGVPVCRTGYLGRDLEKEISAAQPSPRPADAGSDCAMTSGSERTRILRPWV